MDLDALYRDECRLILQNLEAQKESLTSLKEDILQAARLLKDCLGRGGRVFFFGNGGSAADAQHWAAELSGRYKRERRGLAGIALTTDTSALTAIANDYGYDQVFARQVQALARKGDAAVGISTSGRSPNVRLGLEEAQRAGCRTIAVLGRDGGDIAGIADIALVYGAEDTPRIQEFHAVLGHLLCALIDQE
ncbi:MAG: D-sedoheptulose 7-phosphate isomerase [Acidobacteriota bacterium]|jgi:D-sedoheptulose 7-phosphate isomerase